MKRLVAILMVVILLTTFLTGCGKNRLLYNNVNLEKCITLAEYKGIEVDTNSTEFDKYFNEIIQLDVEEYELYTELKEGVVADGDTVNLDYEGKIDGVAFSGGTAKGADLVIGSGKFIDDFEEELIGVAVGETKDVTATFPTPYSNNPDLAGKEAIFTCKINSIKRAMTVEESYSEMKFDSADDYYADITERAVRAYILDKVCDGVKIIEYPAKDMEKINEAIFDFYVDAYKTEYNVDLEELLVAN
ncbi:MAG: FKBP-type peptidyl-prolyl cis-trans isomerase, partial [Clostridia bacterium]|nr:FKBP-type peptidyl-prolyl cis-trans isomerase [Clostridia bacterium]